MAFPLLGAVGNVIGGLIGASGQRSANQMNLKIARENRDWQERMSNTAYQRSARDLEEAGLNRILALGQPASTPAGNVAQMQNEKAEIGKGVSQAAVTAAQIGLIKAQTAKSLAEAKVIAPKAAINEEIAELLTTAKERKGSFYETTDRIIRNRINRRPEGAQTTKGLETRKNKYEAAAQSMGINLKLLLDVLAGMDLPETWSDDQRLQWATKNQDEVKKYIKRRHKR